MTVESARFSLRLMIVHLMSIGFINLCSMNEISMVVFFVRSFFIEKIKQKIAALILNIDESLALNAN